jgi:hypothetical protein
MPYTCAEMLQAASISEGKLLHPALPHLLQLQLVVLIDARHGCEAVPGAVPKHKVTQVSSHLDQRTALACRTSAAAACQPPTP